MKEVENNINLKTLLEELRDLVVEMYSAIIKAKMEVAISGISYDINDLEIIYTSFNEHLMLISQCIDQNNFANISDVVENFRESLQKAKLIPLNLTITALHAGDKVLPVISNFIGEVITEIDKNIDKGLKDISISKHI